MDAFSNGPAIVSHEQRAISDFSSWFSWICETPSTPQETPEAVVGSYRVPVSTVASVAAFLLRFSQYRTQSGSLIEFAGQLAPSGFISVNVQRWRENQRRLGPIIAEAANATAIAISAPHACASEVRVERACGLGCGG